MGNTLEEIQFDGHKAALRALQRAKKIEADKIKKGYAYVEATKTLKVLVPCDRKGKPTEEGRKILESYRRTIKVS